MQRPITPPIALCAKCGAEAKCIDLDSLWRVVCENNHKATKRCGSRHRAICRWNNAQAKAKENN